MKLKDIGEFGFIDRFSAQFLKNLPENVIGIGDDCAVLALNKQESMLVTTDMLIEESHFLRNKISATDLGNKSLAVNLSDIAAMGGEPANAFLSLGIPREIDLEWLDLFFKGFEDLARQNNTDLLGGDTTRSLKHLVINVVVTGKIKTTRIKLRSDAQIGDDVFLTGCIGNSGAGLKILLEDRPMDSHSEFLVREHNRPRAHISEGKWLAGHQSVHAMIDVSDGIDSDLQRIMEKSNCGADIHLNTLPVSDQLQIICNKYKWNPLEIAATGGEDYCLLCTVDCDESEKIASQFETRFGRKLYKIGTITNRIHDLRYFYNQECIALKEKGFDHFL